MAEHQFVLLSLYASAVLLLSSSGHGPWSASASGAAPAPTPAPGPPAAAPAPLSSGPTRSKYIPKWKKQACEAPASLNSASHYECDDNGNVQCLPGWTGDLCDVPICRKGCDPLQGYCKRPGECRCKLGFYGELCNKCIALPGCQHGYCNNSFECICHEGWDGLFCSEPICRLDCHATRGYCEWPGECRCRLGWSGETCKECQVLPGCLHGTCSKPLECKCEKGWTGILCQTPICADGCHKERGYCRRPGECRCKVGWWGENCDECYRYPGCVHGTCHRPWECSCKVGWGGMLCDQELNFCDEKPGLCENNGTCVSLAEEDGSYRCLCTDNFTGRNCEVNKTQVIGMRPPPPPPSTTASPEPENSTEKEVTSQRTTPSTASPTTPSPPPSTEQEDESTIDETSPTKSSTTSTTTPKPTLRRTSTSRTTELRRTSPSKQKHRKNSESSGEKTSDQTKRQEPVRKTSRAERFHRLNEIPNKVSSATIEDSDGRNIEGLSDASLSVPRMRSFHNKDDTGLATEEPQVKQETSEAESFFESVGSSVPGITNGGIAGEPTVLNVQRPRPRTRRDNSRVGRRYASHPGKANLDTLGKETAAKIWGEEVAATNWREKVQKFTRDPAKHSTESDEVVDESNTGESTVVELESDGVIEVRPSKTSSPSQWQVKSESGGPPCTIQQSNDVLSHNHNQASLQMLLSNQSQLPALTYHDKRTNYQVQNIMGPSYVVGEGKKGSNEDWRQPIVNIFVYKNAEGCPCKSSPVVMKPTMSSPSRDCNCGKSSPSTHSSSTPAPRAPTRMAPAMPSFSSRTTQAPNLHQNRRKVISESTTARINPGASKSASESSNNSSSDPSGTWASARNRITDVLSMLFNANNAETENGPPNERARTPSGHTWTPSESPWTPNERTRPAGIRIHESLIAEPLDSDIQKTASDEPSTTLSSDFAETLKDERNPWYLSQVEPETKSVPNESVVKSPERESWRWARRSARVVKALQKIIPMRYYVEY